MGTVVYRIHFTVEDLARTRVAPTPPPLMELGSSVRTLQTGAHPVRLGAWRSRARARLRPEARMVVDLTPPRGWSPTFLTPADVGSARELLERVRATPRSLIRRDLAHVAECHPLPPWARGLADDPDLLRRLCDSLDHVFDVLVAPLWERITSATAADRAVRMRQVVDGGVEGLLAGLLPSRIRWNPPVLELAMLSGFDGDLHLEGRGLLLVPSAFGPDSPAIDIDAQPQPVLRYPIGGAGSSDSPPLFPSGARPQGRSALTALLGPTRAAVLRAVAEHPGCSTKELAARTRIASSSASEHTAVLRSAGLIRTVRHRNTALHSPTAVGIALLDAPDPPERG
ncbi:helix-turn-helix domain-containing protein [Streptomyces sparsogenes]|uniref:winged helix-turn-helix domain-containing protein n=1 Tax=Streptomyces sparsogenes TaxID=67365 RepID=UPI0033FAD9B3